MDRAFLYARSSRRTRLSVFRYRLTKNSFTNPKKIPGLSTKGDVAATALRAFVILIQWFLVLPGERNARGD